MKKIMGSMIASLALFATTAGATIYVERGDAGYTSETAQSVANNTTSIAGGLKARDAVDLFKFKWTGGSFTANTIGSSFDTMLFLFDETGKKLAFNDDYYGLQSYIGLNLNKGNYLLALNRFSYNFNGPLSGFANAPTFTGPNGSYVINFNRAVDSVQVPEPGTLGLIGLAALGLGSTRRRNKA